jgi:hypothetical protein
MAAITDLSELINLQSGGNNGNPENISFLKVPRVAGVAATAPIGGRGCSLWEYDGMPAKGAVPTSGAIPDRTTQGAIPFTPATGGRDKHLIGAGITTLTSGVYLLYDRLFHIGGLNGTSIAAQTIQGSPASPALTRYTGGTGNIVFYEIYTIIGTTSRTLTMTYTNQAGTSGRTSTTITIGGSNFREVTRMQRIPLAADDSGVQSVQQIQLNVSTGTAGNFGITIAQPLAWIPVNVAGTMGWRDYTTGLPGIPDIDPDACLSLMFIPVTTTAPELFGTLATVEA